MPKKKTMSPEEAAAYILLGNDERYKKYVDQYNRRMKRLRDEATGDNLEAPPRDKTYE